MGMDSMRSDFRNVCETEILERKEKHQVEKRYDPLFKNIYGIGVALLCLLLLLPALRVIPVDAQNTSTPADTSRIQELDSQIEEFFRALKRGTSASAFSALLRLSSFDSSSKEVTALQTEVDRCKTQFGEILNWEKYEDESKRIGVDVVKIRYILKYEKYPVIWTFAFYRKPAAISSTPGFLPSSSVSSASGPPWVLIALHFDSEYL
jgi:hypothetical protein